MLLPCLALITGLALAPSKAPPRIDKDLQVEAKLTERAHSRSVVLTLKNVSHRYVLAGYMDPMGLTTSNPDFTSPGPMNYALRMVMRVVLAPGESTELKPIPFA